MQRARKVASTVRTHWKKSLFATGVCVYGVRWAVQKHRDTELMREYCREALLVGSQPIGPYEPNYHVTVILNPVAHGGKGRKMFEKYCAPILHLAGMKVSVKVTEAEGEATELMEIMDNTDAVLVAGGGGTIMETVSGLMRRKDAESYRQTPIGILPVGSDNTLAKRLYGDKDEVALMAEATMSVVRQLKRPIDLIELENLAEDERLHGKKLHGVSSVHMGAWREADNRKDKYWFLGGLKHRATYLFSYLTGHAQVNWSWPMDVQHLQYKRVEQEVNRPLGGIRGWFSSASEQAVEVVEVGEWAFYPQDPDSAQGGGPSWNGAELDISLIPANKDDSSSTSTLRAQLYPLVEDVLSFFMTGMEKVKGSMESQDKVESDSFYLTPRWEEVGENRNLTLDGEEIDIHGPVRISLLRDQIQVFHPSEKEDPSVIPSEPKAAPGARWSGFKNLGSSQTAAALANSKPRSL